VCDLLASPQPLKNVCFLVSAICRNDKSNVLANGFFRRVADHSAALFQLVIMPSRPLRMMASSEQSTIAAANCLLALPAFVANSLLDRNEVLIGGIANASGQGCHLNSLGRFIKRRENGIFEGVKSWLISQQPRRRISKQTMSLRCGRLRRKG
jgi:hypothetical protein